MKLLCPMLDLNEFGPGQSFKNLRFCQQAGLTSFSSVLGVCSGPCSCMSAASAIRRHTVFSPPSGWKMLFPQHVPDMLQVAELAYLQAPEFPIIMIEALLFCAAASPLSMA